MALVNCALIISISQRTWSFWKWNSDLESPRSRNMFFIIHLFYWLWKQSLLGVCSIILRICCFNHIQNAAWWFQIFFIFTPIWPIWGRFPFWLIFFNGVETTNQKCDSQILKWRFLPFMGTSFIRHTSGCWHLRRCNRSMVSPLKHYPIRGILRIICHPCREKNTTYPEEVE